MENFYYYVFAGDFVLNDEDDKEFDFKTLYKENQMRTMKVILKRKMKKLSH